jgi:hypothetical protein
VSSPPNIEEVDRNIRSIFVLLEARNLLDVGISKEVMEEFLASKSKPSRRYYMSFIDKSSLGY